MLRPLYRGRQVLLALRPRIEQQQLRVVDEALSPPQAALFYAMERRDQRHALEVTRRLVDADEHDANLLAAALLHDCGKGAVPLWLRIAQVVAPRFVRVAGREGSAGWRAAAYRLGHHAALGAASAAQAGCSAQAVRLISGRVEAGDEAKLALLMAADDAS